MNIYPEIKKIAGKNASINRLLDVLENNLDCDGLDVRNAHLIDSCKEHDGHLYKDGSKLDNSGLVAMTITATNTPDTSKMTTMALCISRPTCPDNS